MREKFLVLEQVSVPSAAGDPVLDKIDLTIHRGEQWAITGSSGSGKTALAHVLTGRLFHTGQLSFSGPRPLIAIVEQQHRFKNLSGTTDLYYQQRFNASDASGTITVEQEVSEAGIDYGPNHEMDSKADTASLSYTSPPDQTIDTIVQRGEQTGTTGYRTGRRPRSADPGQSLPGSSIWKDGPFMKAIAKLATGKASNCCCSAPVLSYPLRSHISQGWNEAD